MKTDYREYNTTECFIMDQDFISLIENEDIDEINKLLSVYPEKKELIKDAITFIKYLNIEEHYVSDKQIDDDWQKLKNEIKRKHNENKRRHIYLWVSGVAASIAIIISIFIFTSKNENISSQKETLFTLMESLDLNSNEVQVITGNERTLIDNEETITQASNGDLLLGESNKINASDIKTEYITVVVPKGKRSIIKFSDGTTAWINSGSKLVYPKVFAENSRDITIDGEIYLDVAKNKNKPFYVHAKGFDVEVLGTQFNVSAYSDDMTSSVVLVEGSIEISAGNILNKLQPNQGFFSKENTFNIENIDVYPYIAWKEGVMKLNGEPLNEIMKKLSRYYGVTIHFEEQFGKEKYIGKLNLKDPIETTLHSLSLSTPFKYTREEEDIYIQ